MDHRLTRLPWRAGVMAGALALAAGCASSHSPVHGPPVAPAATGTVLPSFVCGLLADNWADLQSALGGPSPSQAAAAVARIGNDVDSLGILANSPPLHRLAADIESTSGPVGADAVPSADAVRLVSDYKAAQAAYS